MFFNSPADLAEYAEKKTMHFNLRILRDLRACFIAPADSKKPKFH